MAGATREELSALLSSSALIVLGVVLSSVSTLLERIVIARGFDPSGYGEVAICLSVMGLGTVLSLIGFNQGIPRFVSRFEDERDVRGMWLTGLVVAIPISLVVTGTLWLNVGVLTGWLFDDGSSADLLRLFLLAIPLNVGISVGVNTFRGLENTRYKTYIRDLFHPGFRILLIAAILGTGSGLLGVGYAYLLAAAVALPLTHLLLRRLLRLVGAVRLRVRELVTFSAPLVLTVVMGTLLTQTDTLMLGYFRTTEAVGLYNAAYPLANSLLLVVAAFGYLYLPLTSRLDAEGRRDDVTDIYRITTRWGYIISFPAFLVLFVYGDDVLAAVFGAEYAPAGVALAIVAVGFFTSAATGHNKDTLAALGDTRSIALAETLTLGLNVVLNVLLIPRFGIEGAAVASATSFLVRNLAISGVLWRAFSIGPFSRETVIAYVSLPLVLVPPALVLSQYVTLSLVAIPVFLVIAGVASVAVVVATGGTQADDAVVLDLVEETVGVEVPYIRKYVLSAQAED